MNRRAGTGEGNLKNGGSSEAMIGIMSAKLNGWGFRRVVVSLVLSIRAMEGRKTAHSRAMPRREVIRISSP